jgi:hypothetical protein
MEAPHFNNVAMPKFDNSSARSSGAPALFLKIGSSVQIGKCAYSPAIRSDKAIEGSEHTGRTGP